MAQLMGCRASSLMAIEDPYVAYCLDEAAATILGALKQGRKLKPKKTKNNTDLLKQIQKAGGVIVGN